MFRRHQLRTCLVTAALLLPSGATALPFAFATDTEETNDLYRIDLGSGAATLIGDTGIADVEGLALRGDGALFGVSDATDELVTCNPTTGACTAVGALGVGVSDPGLAFACNGTLYMSTEDPGVTVEGGTPGDLYRVDTATGVATLVGSLGNDFDGHSIAQGPSSASCPSGMYALDGNGNGDVPRLGCVDLTTGAVTVVGGVGVVVDGQPAIDFDANGTLWMVEDLDGSDIYTVNLTTAAATDVGDIAPAGVGFDGLAIQGGSACLGGPAAAIPSLSGVGLGVLAALLALAGFFAMRRRFS
jgi:hypothetical protein